MSATIDIPLPAALTAPLTPPLCGEFGLPAPAMASVTLPMGQVLSGVADFTRGIPSVCSMNFSLIGMIVPMMASMQCPLAIIALLGDLFTAAESLDPGKLLSALTDGKKAFQSCLDLVTPAGICPFVKSMVLLIVSLLNCVLTELSGLITSIDGLNQSLTIATQTNNTVQVTALQCALGNAQNAAAGSLSALQPVGALLTIAAPFFKILGQSVDPLPSVSGGSDIDSLKAVVNTLTPVVGALQTFLNGVPC